MSSSTAIRRKIKEIKDHPRFFREGYFNDIAVLELKRSVYTNEDISPICLPPPNFALGRVNEAVVAGWGKTETLEQSKILRQTTVSVWELDKCQKAYSAEKITDNFVCAGSDDGRDSCTGDSGGPLMVEINSVWVQIGVVSTGHGCGNPMYPGEFFWVNFYGRILICHFF